MAVKYTKDVLALDIANKGWTAGDYSYGAPRVSDWNEGAKLHIGKYCSIAGGVEVFLGGNHRPDWVTTYPFNKLDPTFRRIKGTPATKGDVVIQNDVWIGKNVTILSGVTVGNGACLGAHALVSKNVPPYAIVGGNPAKILKYRFESDVVKRLLDLQWWDLPDETIRTLVPQMLSTNVDLFLRSAEGLVRG